MATACPAHLPAHPARALGQGLLGKLPGLLVVAQLPEPAFHPLEAAQRSLHAKYALADATWVLIFALVPVLGKGWGNLLGKIGGTMLSHSVWFKANLARQITASVCKPGTATVHVSK